ncbi:bacterial protein of unknown function [bacterium BMS3Abin12]|nr:bacterial protein of unknown function [bacterium BMS3Abin12]
MMRIARTCSTLAAAAGLLVAVSAHADLTANTGATSDYVWRGTTQTGDGAAISGGIDYSHSSGLYVGTWVSNTSFGSQELDLYGGLSRTFKGVGIDLGVIKYLYPQSAGLNWTEFSAGLSYGPFSAAGHFTNDVFGSRTNAQYYEVAVSYPLPLGKGLTVGAHIGRYHFDNPTAATFDSYTDFNASLTKSVGNLGDFAITVSDTTLNSSRFVDGKPKLFVNWTKSFDL